MRRNRTSIAFTLIELLVVVAIIVALLALLMPALNKALVTSQQVVCLSNQRQLGTAMRGYAADHFGEMMPVIHSSSAYWMHLLGKYVSDPNYQYDPADHRNGPMQVLRCPTSEADPDVSTGQFGTATSDWTFELGSGSYGLNLWLLPNGAFAGDPALGSSDNYFTRYTHVARSSSTPVFVDANWVGSWPDRNDNIPTNLITGITTHAYGQFMGRFCIDRHDRAVSVTFHDGSASRTDLADLWTLNWHKNYEPNSSIVIP